MFVRFVAALSLMAVLSAVTFAADKKPADNSAQVQAKVVYGAAAEQRADIDLWISEAVAKCGSPVAQPQTGWTALTGDSNSQFLTIHLFVARFPQLVCDGHPQRVWINSD